MWTKTRLRSLGIFPNYDLAPDGKCLAAMVADDADAEKPITHLTFLLNFSDELRRKSAGREVAAIAHSPENYPLSPVLEMSWPDSSQMVGHSEATFETGSGRIVGKVMDGYA